MFCCAECDSHLRYQEPRPVPPPPCRRCGADFRCKRRFRNHERSGTCPGLDPDWSHANHKYVMAKNSPDSVNWKAAFWMAMVVILLLCCTLLVQWGRAPRGGCEELDWLLEMKDGDGDGFGELTQ